MKRVEDRLKAVKATDDHSLLIAALDDRSPLVVEVAAERISQPRAVGALVRTYWRLDGGAPESDPGCRSRLAVLGALARLEAPEAEEVALRAIRTVQVEAVGFGLEDTALTLRGAAAGCLANIRPPGALVEIGLLLFDEQPNVACSVAERPFAKAGARAAAARSLGALGDPAGLALLAVKLAYAAGELPEVLTECIDAVVALANPRGAEVIKPYLNSADPYLAVAAGTGLATLLREKAVPILEEAIESVGREARVPLVYALGSIRAEGARDAIRRLTRHDDPNVRSAAKELSE